MLSNVLNPIFSPIFSPIGSYLLPKTETDKNLADLKTQLQNQLEKINKVDNPALHKQLSQLQKDLDALDLTQNCLPFQKDRKEAGKLAEGIIGLIHQALLLLPDADALINLPPANQNHRVIDETTTNSILDRCNKILDQVPQLKKLSNKSPILWKDEAWKNFLLFVSGVVLMIAFHASPAPILLGGGAIWLIYQVQINYRKDIFDRAAKLLDRVKTETLEIKQAITELQAKHAKARVEDSVRVIDSLLQIYGTIEKRLESLERKEEMISRSRAVTILENIENKYQALSDH